MRLLPPHRAVWTGYLYGTCAAMRRLPPIRPLRAWQEACTERKKRIASDRKLSLFYVAAVSFDGDAFVSPLPLGLRRYQRRFFFFLGAFGADVSFSGDNASPVHSGYASIIMSAET